MILNNDLRKVIEASLRQSREDGEEEKDAVWMAQGAAIRYGREQGVIGDPLSKEEQAAIAQAVEQVRKGE